MTKKIKGLFVMLIILSLSATNLLAINDESSLDYFFQDSAFAKCIAGALGKDVDSTFNHNEFKSIEVLECNYDYGEPDVISNINGVSILTNLTSISIYDSNIQEMPDELFEIDLLNRIDISRANITEINSNIVNLNNLDSLTLSGNKIQELPSEMSDLNLYSLDLDDNQITTLDIVFDSLLYLSVSNNNINEIGDISNSDYLYFINLSGNEVNDSVYDSLIKHINLETILLSNNNLTSIDERLLKLDNLLALDVSKNNINLEQNNLINFNGISSLNLSSNTKIDNINEVVNYLIYEVSSLEALNVSDTNLNYINTSDYSYSIKSLYLDNNKLSTDERLDFTNFRNLDSLSLNDNNLSLAPIVDDNISFLELSENPIEIDDFFNTYKDHTGYIGSQNTPVIKNISKNDVITFPIAFIDGIMIAPETYPNRYIIKGNTFTLEDQDILGDYSVSYYIPNHDSQLNDNLSYIRSTQYIVDGAAQFNSEGGGTAGYIGYLFNETSDARLDSLKGFFKDIEFFTIIPKKYENTERYFIEFELFDHLPNGSSILKDELKNLLPKEELDYINNNPQNVLDYIMSNLSFSFKILDKNNEVFKIYKNESPILPNLIIDKLDNYFDLEPTDDGWQLTEGKWFYYENGKKLSGQWLLLKNKWHYFDSIGVAIQDSWKKINNKWYFFDNNTNMIMDGWSKLRNSWYYFNVNGSMKSNEWIKEGRNWYYVKDDGRASQSEWTKISSKWYYFNEDTKMASSGWNLISSKWYYINTSGSMKSKEWIRGNDSWYYVKTNGMAAQSEWVKVLNDWYYFTDNTRMVNNGWNKIGKKWSYHYSSGKAAKNEWLKIGKSWYFIDNDCYMLASTSKVINGKKYHFDSSGRMK